MNTLLPLVSPSKMLLLSIMYFPPQILCLGLSSSFLNYAFGPKVMNYQVDFQSHIWSEESKYIGFLFTLENNLDGNHKVP